MNGNTPSEVSSCTVSTTAAPVPASTVATNVPQRIMPLLYLQPNMKNTSTSNNVPACPTTNIGTPASGAVQFAVPQTKSTLNKQKREAPKNLPMKIQLAGGNNTQILHSAQGQNAAQTFAYLGTLIKQSSKGKEATSQKVLLTPMTVQNKSSQMTSLILPSTGGTSNTPKGNVTSLILQSTGTVPPSNKATMTGLLIPNSTTTTSSGKTQMASLIFNNQQTQQNQNTGKKLPVTNILLPNSSPTTGKTANVPNIIRQSGSSTKNQVTGIFLPPTSNSSTGQITSLLIPSNSNIKSNNNQVGLIIPTSSASSTNQMGLLVPATTAATSQLANIILASSNSSGIPNTDQISAGLIFPNNGNSAGAGPNQMASLLIPTSTPNGNSTSVSVSGMIIPTTTSSSSHSQMTGLILPVAMAKQNQSGFVAITPGKNNSDSQQTGGKTSTTLAIPPLQPIIKDGGGKSLLLPKPNGVAVPELIVTPVTENEIEKKECYKEKENVVDVEMTVERTETTKSCNFDETLVEVKVESTSTKADIKSEEAVITNEDGVLLDGEVTVRRLAMDSEETSFPEKQSSDDDVKIEIVKPENDKRLSPPIAQKPEDLDPMQVIEWDQQGVGKLPGSKIKFRMNEFGMMEVVVDETSENQDDTGSSNTGTPNSSRRNSEDKNQTDKQRLSDEIFCCEGCGCYGLYSEFLDTKFCSIACKKIILTRIAIKKKRQEDRLRDIRVRRKKRKMNILAQRAKKEAALRARHHKLLTSHSSNGSTSELQKKRLSEVELPVKAWVTKMAELCAKSKDKCNDVDSGKESTFISEKRESDDEVKSAESPVLSEMDASVQSETVSQSPTVTDDEVDNTQTTAKNGRWSWLNSAGEFLWNSYLQYCNKAKAAPVKLFKGAFPYTKNGFKVGMKLEAIDPEHQSYFCVMTVAEVKGYRLRLHFDGYPDTYDFWVNADSPDIFQPGWCEKNNHRLHPPRGYTSEMFNWIGYLKQCKAQAAAKHHFGKTTGALCPNQFRVGMKLEAVDRKNSSLVCVASVADLIDNRLLIHFDGWGDVYDYWTDPTSPYIHPVGWCEENGHELIPPNNYKNSSNFSWDWYLKETKSVAAPARAFKTRPPTGFKRGIKLEVVDKRAPSLLRVATVSEVHQHQIKIQFDGFPEHFGYWVDDDSPDIHPIYWGQKTGHPVEPPPNGDERSECPTPGCQGDGNLKGGKYTTHTTVAFCPYSAQNLNKETRPNRFCAKPDVYHVPEPVKFKSNSKEPVELTNEENITPNSGENRTSKNKLLTSDKEVPVHKEEVVEEKIERRGRKRKIVEPETTSAEMNRLRREVIESVFQPGYRPTPKQLDGWIKHSATLGNKVNMIGGDPRRWNCKQVASFVNSVVPGLSKPFIDQEIDGEAFLMMSQSDLTAYLGIKLGPAIRIFNCIALLRDKVW